jgi:molybdopterin synthase catalytic subunit
MQITIKFFARLRETIGTNSLERVFNEGTTVGQLIEALQNEFPALNQPLARTIISVNREFSDLQTLLKAGDEVAFFPPVSGGGDDKFAITYDPISLDAIAAKVITPETGAVAVFGGVVRNHSAGKAVEHLEYEAYEAMAVEKMAQVAAEARAQWPDIVDMAIVQRIGALGIGENAVIIAVSSAHRGDGCFEACRFAIERLKQIVPVWKKEFSPDGAVWVEGDYLPN